MRMDDEGRHVMPAGGRGDDSSDDGQQRRPTRTEPVSTTPGGEQPSGIDAVIGDCGVYEHGRRRPGRIPLHEAGEAARRTDGFVWIGLRQPTADDIAVVAAEFSLPALA